MRLPLSHLWFTNSMFESNRSLTRTALLFVIHHYAKFATFAVCFVIIPLPYALTEYSSLQSCCSFFSTPVNSQFDLSYDHSVSDLISQLIKHFRRLVFLFSFSDSDFFSSFTLCQAPCMRSHKLGDKIATLQQLVSPYGKVRTSSYLLWVLIIICHYKKYIPSLKTEIRRSILF